MLRAFWSRVCFYVALRKPQPPKSATLRPILAYRLGSRLFKDSNLFLKECGEIRQIQSQGENVSESKNGDKVAVSIAGPAVGRQIEEGDILYTDISTEEYRKLIKNEKLLSLSEVKALNEIRELKRKKEPKWGL